MNKCSNSNTNERKECHHDDGYDIMGYERMTSRLRHVEFSFEEFPILNLANLTILSKNFHFFRSFSLFPSIFKKAREKEPTTTLNFHNAATTN